MCSKVILVLAVGSMLLGGCRPETNRSSTPKRNSDSPPSPAEGSWSVLQPVKTLQPFVGTWEGESFLRSSVNKTKSGQDLRQEAREKSQRSIEERKQNEPWVKTQLTIKQLSQPIGDSAPFKIRLKLESHSPNGPLEVGDDKYEIRIKDESTIELRKESVNVAQYSVSISGSESNRQLKLVGRQHRFEDVLLKLQQD